MFTIKLNNAEVAEEGFLSNLKDKFKKKSGKSTPDNKNDLPYFNSMNDLIDLFNESPKSLFQFSMSSCNYGKDCIWDLNFEKTAVIDSTLRSALNRAYQNANAALPKIRELAAVQLYDNIEDVDPDDLLITEEQAKTCSREAFKQGLEIDYVSFGISTSNKIQVEFDLTSKNAKDEDVQLHVKDVPNGAVRPSDEVSTFY